MRIIKVDAIDSTNNFLRNLYREKSLSSAVCVVANEQHAGKGQMGTTWQSNPGENLTCSVFMPLSQVMVKDQFCISIATALGIYDTLKSFMVPKLSIKWPNDIMSDKSKICGILIENMVVNDSLKGVVVGMGINVNQTEFLNLPQAGSLKQILGVHLDLDEVLTALLQCLTNRFKKLANQDYQPIKKEYESLLFRKHKASTFLDAKGNLFVGIIQKITNGGKLQILLEDEIIKDFDLKEVQLLY